jgi:hypothetical protein
LCPSDFKRFGQCTAASQGKSLIKGKIVQMKNPRLAVVSVFQAAVLCLVVTSTCGTSVSALAAERIPLNNTKTGVYRALADVIFQSFKKGDMDTAATLGRVLDRTWDQIEENGEHGLNKTSPKLFEDIDEAMDAFIKPVIHADQKAPDPSAVESAYNSYVVKLKTAD